MDENVVKFEEKLKALLVMAKKKKNILEYQEISDFFGDMELDPDKMEKILDYLEANNIDVLRITGDGEEPDDDLLLACFGKADGRLIDPLIQGVGCAGRTSLSCAFDFHADHIGRVGDPDLAFLFLQGEQCAMLCRLDLRDSVCPGFHGEWLIHPDGLFTALDSICDDDAQLVFALIQADPIAPEPAGLRISAAVDASLQRGAVDEELDRADIGIALDVRAE